MLQLLQLLVNKFTALNEILSNDERSLPQVMVDLVMACPIDHTQQALIYRIYQTLAYFTAACLALYDPVLQTMVGLMIEGILHERVGHPVAHSFRLLLAPSDIMNKENFCVIRALRKQRLFAITAPQFLQLWRQATDKYIKDNYLVALAGVLAYCDAEFLTETEADINILPMIIEGTNVQNDNWAKAVFIKCLLQFVILCPSRIEEHLDSLICRMTERTHNTPDSPSDASVEGRCLALDVLAALTKYVNQTLLVKRKHNVLSELDIAVDDCSREVRDKAVHCRMAWFQLGLPEA